jgi:WD40 repeat protein
MLLDVGDEPGVLPLLSHALLETWKRRRGRTITLKGYAESGGVRGAIAQTAETVYASLSPEQQAIAHDIFIRLTQLGEGTEDTRRRAPIDELISDPERAGDVRGVLTLLADARLVSTAEGTAEVAHEALIREWPLLREWLTRDREGLLLHRHLTEAAHEWELYERDSGALYRGARLAQAREWAADHSEPQGPGPHPGLRGAFGAGRMNELERAFLAASIAEYERQVAAEYGRQKRELENAKKLAETEHHAARRLQTRNRIITAVGVAALLLALLAGVFGWQSNQNAIQAEANRGIAAGNAATAQANFTRAEAQRLGAEANVLLKSNASAELIALLGIRAMNQQYSPQGDAALSGAAGLDYPLQVFAGHADIAYTMEYSPDGKYLFTGGPGDTARLWDAKTGQELRQFVYPATGPNANIVWATFSPDSRNVVSHHINHDFTSTARLWDVQTGDEVFRFDQPVYCRHSVFSPDGEQLIMGCDGGVKIWNWRTGQLVRTLDLPVKKDRIRAISSDGQYALAFNLWEEHNTMRLWKLGDTITKLSEFPISPNVTNFSFTSMAVSPDFHYALVGDLDGTTHLMDTATSKELRTFKAKNTVLSVDFSPDGNTVLVSSQDQTVRLYDRETGLELHDISLTDMAWTATFSPDGNHVLTGSDKGPVRVLDVKRHPHLPVFTGHTGVVIAAAFSPDGKSLATGSTDGLRLWDTGSGQLLHNFEDAGTLSYGAAFSADGHYLLCDNIEGTATLWDAATGRAERRFIARSGFQIYDVKFSPDGRSMLTAGTNPNQMPGQMVWVWDLQTGEPKLQINGDDPIFQATFSPDGQYILGAVGNRPVAELWDAKTGSLLREFKGHSDSLNGVAFSPDGKYAATASNDNTACLWNEQTGQEIRQFIGHIEGVWSVAFSPDGETLATASVDGTARLWDVQAGQELRRMAGHTAGVENAIFSPDGKLIAATSDDGTARLWDANYRDTIRYLCSRLLRDFTDGERKQYNIPDAGPTCPK